MAETKRCEQCTQEKELDQFYRHGNMYRNGKRMKMCIVCYQANLAESQRRQAEEWERGRAERERRAEERKRQAEEQKRREELTERLEQERLARQQVLDTWYREQPDRQCLACKQIRSASAFGYSIMREIDGVLLPELQQRCRDCHEEYRKRNRQSYPPCPMCSAPTRVWDFLREYRGYRLDLIKVCCEQCIPSFLALPESAQIEQLRRAMVKAYGDTAVVYALQYDEQFPCQHIGRTKHYARRMAEYKRDWHKDIQRHFILQQLAFGPLSMEYESRWMMHAIKHRWPIDNFELLKLEEDGLGGSRIQAQLTEAVQAIEPLTAPFEVVEPLIRKYFGNTCDTGIVNWYCSQHEAYPGKSEMAQRLFLMERLHGLTEKGFSPCGTSQG